MFRSDIVGADHLQSEGPSSTLEDAWARSQTPGNMANAPPIQQRTVAEQETRDGEDVLAMLSEPSDAHSSFEAPQEEQEDYDWGLSPEQLTQLRAITKELLPAPERNATMSPNHPLNLVPTFEENDITPVDESYMYSGAHGDAATSRELWREQWEGVLTRYADEVWGGLLPLVKEARKEVEEIRNDSAVAAQPTALRRLGAILDHLQRRGQGLG